MASKKLKILGVIGDPISHSLSPLMQNAALAHLKLPYLYMPFHVPSKDLKSFFKSLHQKNLAGFNVTIPHKQAVLAFLDSMSPDAKMIGAVNTIVVKGKKIKGFNTDGDGYLLSLKREAQFSPKNKSVLLLGAGGAARAIAVSLGMQKAKSVTILNRTENTAQALATEMQEKFPHTFFLADRFDNFQKVDWRNIDLLINATSMGMKKNTLPKLPLAQLPKSALVSDIVYNPRNTNLLKQARKLGLSTHEGWGMLLYQGALAFEHFTGKKAPVAVMKKNLLEFLYRS